MNKKYVRKNVVNMKDYVDYSYQEEGEVGMSEGVRMLEERKSEFKDVSGLIEVDNGIATTTSRKLAEKFSKEHRNVVRIIESLEVEDFNALNIEHVHYIDVKGEERREYVLNRDAIAFITMGFTGKEANKFKLEYIKAFNSMEKWIKDRLEYEIEVKNGYITYIEEPIDQDVRKGHEKIRVNDDLQYIIGELYNRIAKKDDEILRLKSSSAVSNKRK